VSGYLLLTSWFISHFQPRCRPLAPNALRLHAGGGIGKARTRAKDDVTCSVSDELRPRLRQTAR